MSQGNKKVVVVQSEHPSLRVISAFEENKSKLSKPNMRVELSFGLMVDVEEWLVDQKSQRGDGNDVLNLNLALACFQA